MANPDAPNDGEHVATRTFMLTMIGTVLFSAAALFILL